LKQITERELRFKSWRDRLFGVIGFDTVRFQVRPKLSEVVVISRFNRAKHFHGRKVRTGEGAFVHDLFNARAGCGDLLAQDSESAGAIADYRGESAESAVCNESSLDDAAENVGINISAA